MAVDAPPFGPAGRAETVVDLRVRPRTLGPPPDREPPRAHAAPPPTGAPPLESRRVVLGLLLALVLPAVISLALHEAGEPIQLVPSTWYVTAIIATAVVGGLGPAALCIILSTFGLRWAVMAPRGELALDLEQAATLLGFLVVATVIAAAVHRLERAYSANAVNRERLEVAITEQQDERWEAQYELDLTRAELLHSELTRLSEHRLVRAMQQVALPASLPEIAGLELAASYIPAGGDAIIGGDWYDAFTLDDGRVVITVGDVSGHGVDAATIMAQLRNGLRAYAFDQLAPAAVLTRLNRLLCQHETDSLATAVVGRYDPRLHTLEWSRAGHPSPVVFDRHTTCLLDGARCGGTLLGAWPDAEYTGGAVALGPGSGVLLFTDGLVERRGESIDDGLDRLRWILGDARGPGEPLRSLLERLAGTLIAEGGRDDSCQLALRRAL